MLCRKVVKKMKLRKNVKRRLVNVTLMIFGVLCIIVAVALALTWTGSWAYARLAEGTLLPAGYGVAALVLHQLVTWLQPGRRR